MRKQNLFRKTNKYPADKETKRGHRKDEMIALVWTRKRMTVGRGKIKDIAETYY